MKKTINSSNNLKYENVIEIYLDFNKDLILIANQVNDSIIYSIQDDNIVETNITNKTIFQVLLSEGNWKRFTDIV